MPLYALPNELLLRIAWFVLKCSTCHCHHVSEDLSALARSSPHLYSVLIHELHRTASALHILFWAIAHSRPNTVNLALNLGADPNLYLRETHYISRATTTVFLGSPLEIPFRLRAWSMGSVNHQLNHDTCTTLLLAGAKLTDNSIITAAQSGDTDLFRYCLPFNSDINEHYKLSYRTLLEIAGSNG